MTNQAPKPKPVTQHVIAAEGAVVYWKVGRTSRALLMGWAACQFESMVPKERTPKAVLHEALGVLHEGKDLLVRPLDKKAAFVVVKETRGQDANDYDTVLTAEVDDDGTVVASSRQAEIQTKYDGLAIELPGASVTSALVKIVGALNGIPLRDAGGVYWLPPSVLERWQKVAAVVESAAVDGDSAMYILRTRMDASTIRAVKDGVVASMMKRVAEIQDEINKGDLGERALQAKADECSDLRRKLAEYEGVLGEALSGVTDSIQEAAGAALQALMLQQAEDATA